MLFEIQGVLNFWVLEGNCQLEIKKKRMLLVK